VALFLDVEGTFDAAWAKVQGVDLDRLLLSRPEYAEQTLDIADAVLRENEIDIIVIDSLAFLTPSKEIEESTEKDLMGVRARKLGSGIRKFVSGLNAVYNTSGRKPTVLFTNQVRMNLGVMFGNPETQTGGMAPQFAASIEVKVRAGKTTTDEELHRPLYTDIHFAIEKSKAGKVRLSSGDMRIIRSDTDTKKSGEFYDEMEIISLAEREGLLERKSGWNLLDRNFSKKELVERELLTDPAFSQAVRTALMNLLLADGA
jgi:recombination protein RecA